MVPLAFPGARDPLSTKSPLGETPPESDCAQPRAALAGLRSGTSGTWTLSKWPRS